MHEVFVGRAAELSEIVVALDAHRLVAIVGPPGVGKTRLAAEATGAVAQKFNEVVSVELSAVSADDDVARAVAAALGVSNSAGGTAIESAASLVGERRVLLSLDNCERVLDSAKHVAEALIERCPNLHILATSRQALGVESERVVTLAPLAAPDAVELFVARAHKGFVLDDSNKQAVTEICRRLDGLPLAIELAAARTDVLAPHQLADMIDQRLSTVVADASQPDPRHRTLDAAVAWSWDLLEPPEQILLRRLSVFAGGATPSAVRAVCAGTAVATDEVTHHLGRLVDHSLAVASDGRYSLLETVRHFAGDQLTRAGEATEARNRHAAWAITFAEQAETHLTGPRQREWIHNLNTENDNLRAALQWLTTDHQSERALRLASALTIWWRATSALTEGRNWLSAALATAGDQEPSAARGGTLFGAALLASVQGDADAALGAAIQSLEIGRRLEDDALCARALLTLGSSLTLKRASHDATLSLRDCVTLSRRSGDHWCLSYGLALLGLANGERKWVEEAIEVARTSGDSIALAYCLDMLALWVSAPATAATLLNQVVSLTTGINCPARTSALIGLGHLALENGDLISAEKHLGDAQEQARREDSALSVARSMSELARLAHLRGDLSRARHLIESALAVLAQVDRCSVEMWLSLARVAAAQNNLPVAAGLADSAEEYGRSALGDAPIVAGALSIRADLFRRDDRVDAAQRALLEALSIFESEGDLRGITDCLDDLGGLAIAQQFFVHGVALCAAAASLREGSGLSRFPPNHPHYDADLAAARQRLSAEEFERAWFHGNGVGLQGALFAARDPAASLVTVSDECWAQLTEKELAVVELTARGLTDREISEQLFIPRKTVSWRLRTARTKVGSLSRSALVTEVLRRQE